MQLVSASQISKYRDCHRAWGHRYLSKLETPPHPSAALGTEVHAQLEALMLEGRPLDFTKESGYIAASAKHFLPERREHLGLVVEKHFTIPSPSGLFGYQGYIDLWLPHGGLPELSMVRPLEYAPTVVDYKTTGNWKYAKTPAMLAEDVQAQLYAKAAIVETGEPTVDLAWIYMATKGARKAKRVHLRVHADHVEEQFAKIEATALEMHAVRQANPNPLELKANPEMCGAYGGCPYQALCNLSPTETVDAMAATQRQRSGDTMSTSAELLARLKAQREAAGIPTAAPAPTSTEADKAAATARAAELVAQSQAAREVVGINPPESALPPAPPVGSVAVTPEAVHTTQLSDGNASTWTVPEGVSSVIVEAVPGAGGGGGGTLERRKPGRPRKAATDPLGADAAAHAGAKYSIDIEASGLESFTVVTVTWAEERFSPVQFQSFGVGPFAATGRVEKGETVAQAQSRLLAELAVVAAEQRAAKAIAFAEFLKASGISR